ncbi:MAG: Nif3-like dinuclear metal center hexameric protein [Opitutales bacterium TMED158]|nr:MAG: Nif3-like dinuclear metal center hexameric protein [Opitutales bacterium TMED158]
MANLDAIVSFCDERARTHEVADFREALNGLQFANNGQVSKIGAAVDAGLRPFEQAIEAGIDFLIVHHGMFWNGSRRIVDGEYAKYKTLIDGNLAVYSCHLPLDAHTEIGNAACLAKAIGANQCGTFLPYEGTDLGLVCDWTQDRSNLRKSLVDAFGPRVAAMEFGSDSPDKLCIVTGSGNSVVDRVKATGADTLVTGELKQHFYTIAQEEGLNLYACGHYATETFGVDALGREAAERFDLGYEFIETDCPL